MLNTTKSWERFKKIPLVIGAVVSSIFPILVWQGLIDFWLLFLGLIPLMVGGILTNIFNQLEYKPGEPSTKCIRCKIDVYLSSMDEHLMLCRD